MLPIPSAIDKAKQLIKDNPELFKQNDLRTIIAITQALIEYNQECAMFQFDDYVTRDIENAKTDKP